MIHIGDKYNTLIPNNPFSKTCGFFSDCGFRLYIIMNYYTNYEKLPDFIDGSKQFLLYKKNADEDTTKDFFADTDLTIEHKGPIDFYVIYQNKEYKSLAYSHTTPFVKKYFSPSEFIVDKKQKLLEKYAIDPTNTIGVYYRGTDKKTEIEKVNYSEYMDKLKEIYTGTETILIQSDEKQFIDYAKEIYPNCVVFTETKTSTTDTGIHYENTKEENYNDIQYFFASVLILSECKHIVLGISNCSLWMCLYRGNSTNIHQHFNGKFISS